MPHLIFPLLTMLLGVGYSSYHIWTILPLTTGYRILAIVLWILPLVMLLTQFAARDLPMEVTRLFYIIGSAWVFVLLYVVMIFLVLDVARIFVPAIRPFLSGSLYGTLGITLFLLGIFTYGNARYHDKVRVALDIPVARTLKTPLKVIALSDLHLGYTIGRGELATWVDMLNAEQADLILIAGDLVDGDTRPLMADSVWQELGRLQARLGVYASLGNHEYIGGEAQRGEFISRTGITLLRDSVATIGDDLYIIGRDDRTNGQRATTAELVRDLDPSRVRILLDHQPYALDESQHAGIDLQISGHTHRGQVFPINLIVDNLYEQAHGYLRRGDTHYYISSGLGIWGGKFRIGTQSEYAVLTLSGSR